MEILRIILSVIFVIDCIGLTIVVMFQESKGAGLGALAGGSESYWGKNRGRSMEGGLSKASAIMGVVFFVLAAILNMNF